MRRVVITGAAGITPIGTGWETVRANLRAMKSGVGRMKEWEDIAGMASWLGAPVADFEIPPHYSRKMVRTMGRVGLLAIRSAELAIADAGLTGDSRLQDGSTGVSWGSTNGSAVDSIQFMQQVGVRHTVEGVHGSLFPKFMSHTCAANISLFFHLRGRIIPTCSACTSGSQGIGFGYEAIKSGLQDIMVCGGAEELHPIGTAVFDVMFATSRRNDAPTTVPRPFDRDRDGLVVGEGAGALILESLDSARQRGADILCEVVGFATNGDGEHMVNPSRQGMLSVMQLALRDAGLTPDRIDYVSAHGTSTEIGDVAESNATRDCFGRAIPTSSLKSYMGHTLGACGAIEAWVAALQMKEGWVAPTLNLAVVDPACGDLDYVMNGPRELTQEYVMSNNFAFGGINTSLILRRWD